MHTVIAGLHAGLQGPNFESPRPEKRCKGTTFCDPFPALSVSAQPLQQTLFLPDCTGYFATIEYTRSIHDHSRGCTQVVFRDTCCLQGPNFELRRPEKRCQGTTFCDPESPFLVFCGLRIPGDPPSHKWHNTGHQAGEGMIVGGGDDSSQVVITLRVAYRDEELLLLLSSVAVNEGIIVCLDFSCGLSHFSMYTCLIPHAPEWRVTVAVTVRVVGKVKVAVTLWIRG